MTRFERPVLLLAAALLMGAPAQSASAATPSYPSITKVSPLKLGVGDTMTIKGKAFRPGVARTTVVFKRDGGRAIFVKANKATTTQLTVVIPAKMANSLSRKAGKPTETRFRLRVLTARFGRRYTSVKSSPMVSLKSTKLSPGAGPNAPASLTPGAGPNAPASPPAPPTPVQQCAAEAAADAGADSDGDKLSNGLEGSAKTDPCTADTDTDGVWDGYEYRAAKDLNGAAVPYPGKRPWPNPLDGSDADYDFDGDGLSLGQEHLLWQSLRHPIAPDDRLGSYSDGTQNTGGPVAVTNGTGETKDTRLLDRPGNGGLLGDGNLTDEERDADDDGLSNQVEFNTSGTQTWWKVVFTNENPYKARLFSNLDPTVTDSDGDDIIDGLDDQDNDAFDNITEMQRTRARAGLRVAPFNPCLPNPHSITCSRYVPIDPGTRWPPFDGSETAYDADDATSTGSVIPFTFPGTTATLPERGWDGLGGPQGS